MATRMKYCPNCEQNIVPKLVSRQAAGCVLFIAWSVAGFIRGASSGGKAGMILTLTTIAIGIVTMMSMAHGKRQCPICGTDTKSLLPPKPVE